MQLTKELQDSGEDVEFLDLCFIEQDMEVFRNKIVQCKPGIVVFSVRNIDNETYINPKIYLDQAESYVKLCQESGSITTIIGGIGFLINYKAIIKYLSVDYGIVDRSFSSILTLIRNIKNNKSLSDIDNLIYRKNGQVIFQNIKSADQKTVALDWDYILSHCSFQYKKRDKLQKGPSSIGIQSKTGCYFQCIHCQISEIEGRDIKQYPYEYMIHTLKTLQRFGVETCFFTDNIFNFPYQHAYMLCKKIIEADIHIKWSCYLHPKYMDRKLVQIMKQAGCVSAQFGIDTASDKLLKLWRKGFTVHDIIQAGHFCEQEKLNCSFSLMVGGWGETKETLRESLQVLREAKAKFIWGALGVRVQVRTGLYQVLLEANLIQKGCDLLKPIFYLSPGIQNDYKEVMEEFKAENPDIIVKINEG